ncbi:MAG: RNA polymerase sporulation sigma factor SigG [Ruminococcaceae bacterium]|nr:RNA polymerase sporulation sigma factor SigG [Oscillospiraceae bacterium]
MYHNKVILCGVNTSKLKVLTEEEKREIMKRVREGDEDARREMICGNLRLVLSIVQRFAGRKENPDDLFQVGCIGLIKAVDNFDLDKEVMFSTYAVPMIVGEVRRYLRDSASVRISRSVRDLAYKSLQARDELSAALNRDPTPDEIAAHLGVPREQVVNAMEAIIEPISLYEPVFSENGDSLYVIDQLSDTSRESTDESWLENIALREAVRTLTPREQKIIRLRYYRDKTQMEIASEIGISQAQVSRVEKAALEKLRKQL